MCGIAGLAWKRGAPPPDPATLEGMCHSIAHRGPDEAATAVEGRVGLGIRRLAIIDLADSHQPLLNEDGSIRAVFNGEIYNFRALRAELTDRGHHLRTGGDGEVLVHLWEDYGPDLLHRLNGMFAFAIHDVKAGCLFLARDHLGIKPLYYALTDQELVFGSELKAVLASGRVDRALDYDAVREFLVWEYVPAPRTLLRGIRKLEPGAYLTLDLDRFTSEVGRWWHLPALVAAAREDAAGMSPADWADRVDQETRTAVRGQLVSDVPLGAFLSGGVDSSLVVSGMDDPHTFSIGFDDPSYNELKWSERVATALGAHHRTQVIRPDVIDLFGRLMHHMDDPIADFSIFPTYLVSRLARKEVTVALSGDGGDELFGGYETYVAQQIATRWRRLVPSLCRGFVESALRSLRPRPEKKGWANKARRFAEGLEHPESLGPARWRRFASSAVEQRLFTCDALSACTDDPDRHIREWSVRSDAPTALQRGLFVDVFTYLTDNCLVKTDRMSMACSLEVRVPLLDPGLVVTAFAVPDELKVRGTRTKLLLKQVAARHVPRECVYRPKEGFSIPMKHWLRGPFQELVQTHLDSSRLEDEGLFRAGTVAPLVNEHMAGTANHSHLLWALVVLQEWRRRWSA